VVFTAATVVISREDVVEGRGDIFSEYAARVTVVRGSRYREDDVDGFVL
jgi:hypothetical protein